MFRRFRRDYVTNEYSKGYITFKEGVKACVPTILGYLGIGIAAGVVGKSSGLSLLEITLLSVIVYAGSAQFIITGMLLIHSPVTAIVFTTFLVNLRHFLMSLSVADYFRKEKMLPSIGIGTLLTDESYGVLMTAIMNRKQVSVAWTNGLNVTAYLVWILSTMLGGILGEWLPNPEKIGLDFALSAMFIGLIVLQVERPMRKRTKQTVTTLLTVIVSLYVLMRWLSPEMSVLIATLLGCGMGVMLHDDDK
ncbi:branched-chain amino acid transporter AzlC [Vagococcus acidifermentans]|uniref:Branched-chain amino acid transporter AzlC n=1 Tax=Vagococcus acidifermentans TaxID=564710 RepID=A0A430AP35_9ENTE|nr:branched-chain amino acid transporter AzlC [Vagococcus acidifermentans]